MGDVQSEAYYCSKEIVAAIEDGVRKEMEKCESLDALLWIGHSAGASSGGLMKAVTSKVNLEKK